MRTAMKIDSRSQHPPSGCQLQSQNDMKYTSNGFIQNRNTYLTLLSPLFFKHKKRLISNHCRNWRLFEAIIVLAGAYEDREWNGANQRRFAPFRAQRRCHGNGNVENGGRTKMALQHENPLTVRAIPALSHGGSRAKISGAFFFISLQKNSLTIILDSCHAHGFVYI